MTNPDSDEKWLTVDDASKILKVSKRSLYRYIASKRGPKLVRFGRAIRITKSELVKWAEKDHPPIWALVENRKRKPECSA